MNIVLLTTKQEKPIDDDHWYVTVGPNCWGRGATEKEALKNCKVNAGYGYRGHFITRIAPKAGFNIDPVDGGIGWAEAHDAKNCPVCTVGKGIGVHVH